MGTSCLQSKEELAFFETSIFPCNEVRRYLNQNNIIVTRTEQIIHNCSIKRLVEIKL